MIGWSIMISPISHKTLYLCIQKKNLQKRMYVYKIELIELKTDVVLHFVVLVNLFA